MKKNLILIVALIGIGLIGRIIPHPYNFTPMTAIALLSAYAFKNKWIAIGLPLVSFWISDLIINNFVYAGYYENFRIFSPSFLWVYGSILCISIMGRFAINNIDMTIISQKINISSKREVIEVNISKLLSLDENKINLKGKSVDKLGIIGNNEASAALVSISLSNA